MLAHFITYLRATQSQSLVAGAKHTLGQELELVRAHLGVVAVRMAGRLEMHLDVAEALRNCELPALSLATLVENAVKHGVGPAPPGGCISVRAVRSGATLEVSVIDTGVG